MLRWTEFDQRCMGVCHSRRRTRRDSPRITRQEFPDSRSISRIITIETGPGLAEAEDPLQTRSLSTAHSATHLSYSEIPEHLLRVPFVARRTILHLRQAEVPIHRRSRRSWIWIYKFLIATAFVKKLLRVRKAWSAQGKLLKKLKHFTRHLVRRRGVLLYRRSTAPARTEEDDDSP